MRTLALVLLVGLLCLAGGFSLEFGPVVGPGSHSRHGVWL